MTSVTNFQRALAISQIMLNSHLDSKVYIGRYCNKKYLPNPTNVKQMSNVPDLFDNTGQNIL